MDPHQPQTEEVKTVNKASKNTKIGTTLIRRIASSSRKILVFVLYIGLSSTQYVLMKSSQKDNKYKYNVATVVMITEILKLMISLILYFKDNSCENLKNSLQTYWKVLLLYFVPASLYCVSNNLVFVNLQHFDPTTYNVLQQFKIVMTGILFEILLKQKLSRSQWMALILLTIGCALKQLGYQSETNLEKMISFEILLIFAQIGCTSLSGVFNESLIKDYGAGLHIMVHNIFMYLDSIVCNLIAILLTVEVSTFASTEEMLKIVKEPLVIAIIITGALNGIVVSLFLKYFNSIVRVFSCSVELILMALLCWLNFGTAIDVWTVISIVVVSLATYLYVKTTSFEETSLDNPQTITPSSDIEVISQP